MGVAGRGNLEMRIRWGRGLLTGRGIWGVE